MRILVTNDDGIDSIGLHVLARAMTRFGHVVVAAPDSEYSGASAALGAIHLIRPEVRRTHVDGVPEADLIRRCLEKHAGRIAPAAIELGISRPALYERLDRLGLPRPT